MHSSSHIECQVTASDDHGRPSVLMRAAWQAASSSLCASILAQTVGAQVEEGSAAALQGLEVPGLLALPIVAHLLYNLHPAALDVTSCTCHAHCAWLSRQDVTVSETWTSIRLRHRCLLPARRAGSGPHLAGQCTTPAAAAPQLWPGRLTSLRADHSSGAGQGAGARLLCQRGDSSLPPPDGRVRDHLHRARPSVCGGASLCLLSRWALQLSFLCLDLCTGMCVVVSTHFTGASRVGERGGQLATHMVA